MRTSRKTTFAFAKFLTAIMPDTSSDEKSLRNLVEVLQVAVFIWMRRRGLTLCSLGIADPLHRSRRDLETRFELKDNTMKLSKQGLLTFARLDDFLEPVTSGHVEKAKALGADVLVYSDRPWMKESTHVAELSNSLRIALLEFDSYDLWLSRLNKDTRYEVRKSRKNIQTRIVERATKSEAEQIVGLYRESPFREGRYFAEYSAWTVEKLVGRDLTDRRQLSIVAVYEGQIVGFAKTIFNGQVAVVGTMLSSLAIRKKVMGVSDALLSAQIEALSQKGIRFLVYGKLDVLAGLDRFKASHGFTGATVAYCYLPLTTRAKLLAPLGMYQPFDIAFSTRLKFLIPHLSSIQHHLPLSVIQKLHLYA